MKRNICFCCKRYPSFSSNTPFYGEGLCYFCYLMYIKSPSRWKLIWKELKYQSLLWEDYEYGKFRIIYEIVVWILQAFPFYRKVNEEKVE